MRARMWRRIVLVIVLPVAGLLAAYIGALACGLWGEAGSVIPINTPDPGAWPVGAPKEWPRWTDLGPRKRFIMTVGLGDGPLLRTEFWMACRSWQCLYDDGPGPPTLRDRFDAMYCTATLAGFPYPALIMNRVGSVSGDYTITNAEQDAVGLVGGLPVPDFARPRWWPADRLNIPVYPSWPGLAADAALWTLLFWLLLLAPAAVRRARRRLGRRCTECGYPIGLSPVCTECGAGVAAGGT